MKDIPLHDIKPLVEVPDSSFTYVIILGILAFVIVVIALYFLYRFARREKVIDMRKMYLKRLQEVDFSDAKTAAYEISFCAKELATTQTELDLLENLDSRLAQYKYKKEVEKIDEETIGHYRLFLEVVDVA